MTVIRLSPDQTEVLRQLALGLSREEICRQLGWSENRYWSATGAALVMLGAKNLIHAVAIAVKAGLVE